MTKDYFKLVPAVYIILEKGGQILLAKRQNTGWEDGNYTLPAGHLDGGESALVALKREAKEELGIEIDEKSASLVHLVHRLAYEKDHERMDLFFKITNWQGVIQNQEPDKCSELAWFDNNSLPDHMVPFVHEVLQNINKGIYYSEFDWDKS